MRELSLLPFPENKQTQPPTREFLICLACNLCTLCLAVTVQCLRDGYFILVISRDMLDYPIILESVRLSYAQAGCSPVRKTESFLVFRFPLTQCGTTVQVRMLSRQVLIYLDLEGSLISLIDHIKMPVFVVLLGDWWQVDIRKPAGFWP